MEWAYVLVIILSVFLALFLALAIALVVLLIKITRQIKSVTSVAERTALKFESAADSAAAFASPLAVAKLFKSFMSNRKK
ncbi:MAG TPA: hypothetical protein PKV96_01990 [Candidatus Saccharimonas sp.]|jgi:hypothetical protein|nr:hypothetical protein [Candidatus Saccharimonas sp.]